MRITLLEPYCTGSHRAWAEGYCASSQHEVRLVAMEGRFWKWRMHGGALELASQCRGVAPDPDLILVTDMVNLPAFLALTRPRFSSTAMAAYFHENQLTYPLAPGADLDLTYGFMNFLTGLCADWVFFNSPFHRSQFLAELPRLLKHFPDYNHLETAVEFADKSSVLPVGCNLRRLDAAMARAPIRANPPLILWNQRWEYDKGPDTFFRALSVLKDEGVPFRLALAGENYSQKPDEFIAAREVYSDQLVHYGYASPEEYARLLWQADVVASTAIHEFFGIAVVEAIYCGAWPLLPKGLTYPELIPPSLHSDHLYDGFEDLLRRLRELMLNPRRPSPVLRQSVSQFDWSALSPVYDRALNGVAEKRRSTAS